MRCRLIKKRKEKQKEEKWLLTVLRVVEKVEVEAEIENPWIECGRRVANEMTLPSPPPFFPLTCHSPHPTTPPSASSAIPRTPAAPTSSSTVPRCHCRLLLLLLLLSRNECGRLTVLELLRQRPLLLLCHVLLLQPQCMSLVLREHRRLLIRSITI